LLQLYFHVLSFAVIENLRHMLYQYRPTTSFYIGHRYAHGQPEIGHYEGYMAGDDLKKLRKISNRECSKVPDMFYRRKL
jgi:hypothetical protein